MTRAELIAFEEKIASAFNAGEIPYPVHLESGNEDALIGVFQDIGPSDWVCGSWRMHLKALLKGVPPEELEAAIRAGRSMSLCFPEYRVLGSAIVGGSIPIALGIALGIARTGGPERVHCFLGDMTAMSGIFHEARTYARNFALPVRWIVEDNGVSVMTDTREAWGGGPDLSGVVSYRYRSRWPHAGAGVRVQF